MRTAINAAIIQDDKLLLVRKRSTWILPGGKPEIGENDLECLCREIDEELSGTQIKDINYYNQFQGKTPHKRDILKAKVYFANIDGQLYSVRDGDSISEVTWANDFSKYNLSDITSKIVNSLQQDKYI
ncbi:NUDIX domain-containing protein [Candidatus Woesearchaeota archaeon]|nr:NUDIX domain-containing protein [Candidatus Woesearchaeota archaeon]